MTRKTTYEAALYERGYQQYKPTSYDAHTGVSTVFVKQFLGGEWHGVDMEKCPSLTCYRHYAGGRVSWLSRMVIPIGIGNRRHHFTTVDLWPFTDVELVKSIKSIEEMSLEAWRSFNMFVRATPVL